MFLGESPIAGRAGQILRMSSFSLGSLSQASALFGVTYLSVTGSSHPTREASVQSAGEIVSLVSGALIFNLITFNFTS